MNIPRKALVTGVSGAAPTYQLWDSAGPPSNTVGPAFLGGLPLSADSNGNLTVPGAFSGVLSMPQQNSQALILSEGAAGGTRPVAAVAMTDAPTGLPTLAAGETAIYGADGRVLMWVKGDGTTTLWSKSGKPSTTIDANGNLSVGGALTMAGNTTATSATGGSATALPAQPAAYLIVQVGATTYKTPLYNT